MTTPEIKYAIPDFWDHVEKTNNCWLWTGALNAHGYGRMSVFLAHRVAYINVRGDIPKGLELDHLCRNPQCVNPDHLEAVTHAENVRRGLAGQHMKDKQGNKTHCRQGHSLTKENIRIKGSWILCRKCSKIAQNRRRAEYRKRTGYPKSGPLGGHPVVMRGCPKCGRSVPSSCLNRKCPAHNPRMKKCSKP